MYAKLVFRNVKRSVKDYLLYIVTITICVAMFYAFLSISSKYYNPVIGAEFDITMLAGGMKIAICAVSLLLLFLINYVNRYMLQKRQKEFAVEMITGMEQKTIGRIFFAETFLLSFLSLSAGIIMGMLASQFITAMLLASFGKTYAFTWTLFPDTVLLTAGFFMLCQIVVGMGNVRILNKSKIIELMTSDRRNEKPLHKRFSGYKEVYLPIRRYSPHKGYAVFSCFSVSFASVCGSVGKWISPTKLKTISTF